jgi:hypothetical protein
MPSAGQYRPLPPGSPPPSGAFSPGPASRRRGLVGALVEWASDVPIKIVYGIAAALVTALIVFLIFLLFSGDQPAGAAGSGVVPPVSGAPAPPFDAGGRDGTLAIRPTLPW